MYIIEPLVSLQSAETATFPEAEYAQSLPFCYFDDGDESSGIDEDEFEAAQDEEKGKSSNCGN